jgi:hypothetical protein
MTTYLGQYHLGLFLTISVSKINLILSLKLTANIRHRQE